MASKILYFTAEAVPTPAEVAEIENLNKLTGAKFEVGVRNRLVSSAYGAGVEACDSVAGTPPAGAPWNAKPVISDANAAGGFAPVYSGQQLVVPVTGTYVTKAVPTVVNGLVTAIVLS